MFLNAEDVFVTGIKNRLHHTICKKQKKHPGRNQGGIENLLYVLLERITCIKITKYKLACK
jgi:hypothetical protein